MGRRKKSRPKAVAKAEKFAKLKRGKPGPKSLRDSAVLPKKAGRRMRAALRLNEFRSSSAMNCYRAGFNCAWKNAGNYMARIKIPRPGEFDSKNQHGGRLWAVPHECKLTGIQAARILEHCWDKKISEAQLRQVKKTLSYAHFLRTGDVGKNWDEVRNTWDSFGSFGEVVRPTKPEHVATPQQLKRAFTTEWTANCGMPLVKWSTAVLCAWDWCVAGARPNSDLDKIKECTDIDFNFEEGYCSTGFVGGRSKLSSIHRLPK